MKTILLFAAALTLAASAAAQTKISGALNCPKPDQAQMLPVGDRPNHSLSIFKGKCTWSKAIEMEGTQTQSDDSTGFSDMNGNRFREQGYDVVTMANGDKLFVGWQGTGTAKDGAPQGAEGKWRFTGGTGKLKGIKGTGTYKNTATAEGGFSAEIEGEYSISKK